MSLPELIQSGGRTQNQQIQIQKAQWDIKQAEEAGTHGYLNLNSCHSSPNTRTTAKGIHVQESINRLGQDSLYRTQLGLQLHARGSGADGRQAQSGLRFA